MKTNSESPAFPISDIGKFHYGLTKREYFAAMAIQGLLSREGWSERITNEQVLDSLKNNIATAAVEMADELLKQLDKS